MKTRLCCFLTIASQLPVGIVQAASAGALEAPDKPNILVLMVDDLRPELGIYGVPRAVTPAMDALGARSVVFDRAYCQYPVCGPSRASLLTGLSPDRLGIYGNRANLREHVSDFVSMPQLFQQAGYETVSIGKVYDARVRDDRGWDAELLVDLRKHLYAHPENQLRHEENDRNQSRNASRPWKAGPAVEIGGEGRGQYMDEIIAERARGEIARLAKSGKPFFLAVGLHRPHLPFAAPEEFWNLYDRAEISLPAFDKPPDGLPEVAFWPWLELRAYEPVPQTGPLDGAKTRELIHGYLASTSFVDSLIGSLMDELKRHGLEDNTIIVLLGDHGYHLGELGQWVKYVNTELASRAPLMIHVPETAPRRLESPVEFLDIYPTLAALANLDPPKDLHGRDLSVLMRDGDTPASLERPALTQLLRFGRAMGHSLRKGDFRYNLWTHPASGKVVAEELYDYRPHGIETVNKAGDQALEPTQAALRKELESLAKHRGWSGRLTTDRNE